MRSFKYIIIGILLAIIVFFVMSFQQMRMTVELESRQNDKQKVISEALSAQKKLAKMERELQELKDSAQFVKKMILDNDEAVFNVIKDISSLASKNGLKNAELAYSGSVNPALEGFSLNRDLGRAYGLKQARAVFIAANFDAEYPALESFLNDIFALKSVISIENVTISRNIDILPRQRISVLMAVYMY